MEFKLLLILSCAFVADSYLFRPANHQNKAHLLKPTQQNERWKGKLHAYSPFKLDYHIPASFGFRFAKPEGHHKDNIFHSVPKHPVPKPEHSKGLGFYSLDELEAKEKHAAKAQAHIPVYKSYSHQLHSGLDGLRPEFQLHNAPFGTNFPVNAHLVHSHHKF